MGKNILSIPRDIVALLLLCIVIAGLLYMGWKRTANDLRAKWDCILDVSGHLAATLNEHYRDKHVYPRPSDHGYCNAMDLLKYGLHVERSFSKSVEEAGRDIEFKGDLVDPFRQMECFPDEERVAGWYYHSASAEWWMRMKGYPLRYYCSRDRQWAVILSNFADGDIDVDASFLEKLDVGSQALDTLIIEFRERSFDYTETFGNPTYQENRGPYTSGDFVLLLWKGERYRVSRTHGALP